MNTLSTIDVLSYEDYIENSKNVTVYTITVKQKSPSGRETTFKLKKRYSDFARLFTSLKQIFPGIESFSFPKKSVFSNQSQHVKERRRQSFDDFLKVLVRMDPLPIEVADFLELCANTPTESKSIFPEAIRNMMSGTSTITKETPPSPKESSSPEIAKPALSRLASDKLKLASITTATGSKDLTTFVKLLPSSVFLVVPIYAVLVGFDFIDISTTTTERMVLTLLSLSFACGLFRFTLGKVMQQ